MWSTSFWNQSTQFLQQRLPRPTNRQVFTYTKFRSKQRRGVKLTPRPTRLEPRLQIHQISIHHPRARKTNPTNPSPIAYFPTTPSMILALYPITDSNQNSATHPVHSSVHKYFPRQTPSKLLSWPRRHLPQRHSRRWIYAYTSITTTPRTQLMSSSSAASLSERSRTITARHTTSESGPGPEGNTRDRREKRKSWRWRQR